MNYRLRLTCILVLISGSYLNAEFINKYRISVAGNKYGEHHYVSFTDRLDAEFKKSYSLIFEFEPYSNSNLFIGVGGNALIPVKLKNIDASHGGMQERVWDLSSYIFFKSVLDIGSFKPFLKFHLGAGLPHLLSGTFGCGIDVFDRISFQAMLHNHIFLGSHIRYFSLNLGYSFLKKTDQESDNWLYSQSSDSINWGIAVKSGRDFAVLENDVGAYMFDIESRIYLKKMMIFAGTFIQTNGSINHNKYDLDHDFVTNPYYWGCNVTFFNGTEVDYYFGVEYGVNSPFFENKLELEKYFSTGFGIELSNRIICELKYGIDLFSSVEFNFIRATVGYLIFTNKY